jgi:hypothetical protein
VCVSGPKLARTLGGPRSALLGRFVMETRGGRLGGMCRQFINVQS